MYRTQDSLPFLDEYFDDSMDWTFFILKKAETQEEKTLVTKIMETHSDGYDWTHVPWNARKNMVYKKFSIKDGFLGYAENDEDLNVQGHKDAMFIADRFNYYEKVRYRTALTAVVNGDTFVIRIFLYATHESNHDPHGYHEIFRYCFQGGSCWIENKDGIKAISPGFIFTRDRINFRNRRYTKDTGITDAKQARKDFYSVFHFADRCSYMRSVNDFLKQYAKHMRGKRIFKNVPEEIIADLSERSVIPAEEYQDNTLCKTSESSDPPEEDYTAKFIIKVEPFGTKGVLFRGYYINQNVLTEAERMYYANKKLCKFVYNEFTGAFVSTSARIRLSFWLFRPDTCHGISFEQIFDLLYKAGLSEEFRNTDLCINHVIITMEDLVSKTAEQAVKIGAYKAASTIRFCKKKYREMNLTELLCMPAKYIRKITWWGSICNAEDLHEKCMEFKELFPDPDLRVKIMNSLYMQRYLIDWMKDYYEEDGRSFMPTLRAIVKTAERAKEYTTISIRLQEYRDYAENRDIANLYFGDHRFGKYLKAGQIRKMHDRVIAATEKVAIKDQAQFYAEPFQEVVKSHKYRSRFKQSDQYIITGPETIDDLYTEGHNNNNCVGSYSIKMARRKTSIYFLRKASSPQKTYYTIEVMDNMMLQCYGIRNTIDSNKTRRAFVKQWAEENNLKIACGY